MPRLDHRVPLEDRLTSIDHALLGLIRQVVNEVREHDGLKPYSETDILRLLRQTMQDQRKARG